MMPSLRPRNATQRTAKRALYAGSLALMMAISPLIVSAKVVGELAPDFLGTTRQGKRLLASDYRGKPLIVTYWAAWCGPCLRELPMLEGIQKHLGPDKLRVVAVNIEDREKFRMVSRKMWDWSIELANDPHKEARDSYGVMGIPHLVVVGKDGVMRKVFRGYAEASLEKIVREVVDVVNEDPLPAREASKATGDAHAK